MCVCVCAHVCIKNFIECVCACVHVCARSQLVPSSVSDVLRALPLMFYALQVRARARVMVRARVMGDG